MNIVSKSLKRWKSVIMLMQKRRGGVNDHCALRKFYGTDKKMVVKRIIWET